jgi:hypothetical protein
MSHGIKYQGSEHQSNSSSITKEKFYHVTVNPLLLKLGEGNGSKVKKSGKIVQPCATTVKIGTEF